MAERLTVGDDALARLAAALAENERLRVENEQLRKELAESEAEVRRLNLGEDGGDWGPVP